MRWLVELINQYDAVIGSIATIVIAIFTGTLWKTTRDTLVHNKRTQRAFVFLEGFEIELHTADKTDTDVSLLPKEYKSHPGLWMTRFAVLPKWKNSGSTPTKNMTVQVNWMDATEKRPDYSYAATKKLFFLGPNSAEVSEVIELGAAQRIINWSWSPKPPEPLILIWGRADYEDTFGGKHFIEWCRSLRFYRSGKGEPLRPNFIQWGEYNRSD